MNQKVLLGIVVAVVLVGVGYVFFSGDKKEAQEGVKTPAVQELRKDASQGKAISTPAEVTTAVESAKGGEYVPYDSAKLAMAKEGDVVLFFRASWCPACRAADKSFREHASSIPSGLTLLDVDYDKYGDLKKQYGVTSQHTFVQVDENGKEIAKWMGSSSIEDVVKNLK